MWSQWWKLLPRGSGFSEGFRDGLCFRVDVKPKPLAVSVTDREFSEKFPSCIISFGYGYGYGYGYSGGLFLNIVSLGDQHHVYLFSECVAAISECVAAISEYVAAIYDKSLWSRIFALCPDL